MTPAHVEEAFTGSLAGVYPSRYAFAEAEFSRRGWKNALADAQIPAWLIDLRRLFDDLLRTEFRAIHARGGDIAVFRRATSTST